MEEGEVAAGHVLSSSRSEGGGEEGENKDKMRRKERIRRKGERGEEIKREKGNRGETRKEERLLKGDGKKA